METNTALNSFLQKIKEVYPQIEKKYHISSLEVFGSFLRGEEKEDSDLDLLVTFSVSPSLFGFVRLENYLSDTLGVKVDLVMKDSLKPNIGERILAEAQSI